MKSIVLSTTLLGFVLLLTSQLGGQQPINKPVFPPDQQATATEADSLFGLNHVIDVHLQVAPAEWAKMQPPKGTKTDGRSVRLAFKDVLKDAAEGNNFWSDKSTRPGLAGYLGIDHQYGKADVTIDGDTVPGVGLRYKGNGTFLEGRKAGKLSFKIDFNEYQDEQEFRGLSKINLNSNITDPSMLREALSYQLFREAGIYCSRIGFARVSVTVPGKSKRRSHGLYTVVEQVDKRFLKNRYGSAQGFLLKPSTFGVFRYFGEDWTPYEKAYIPKTEPTVVQKKRVVEFARLLNKADDTTFDQQVDEILDVDQFLRFLAVNVLLSNLDSFLGGAQNYYLYLEPVSNKFQFLPWDMDHSFGAFPLVGSSQSRRNLSINHPGGEKHTLIERLLAIPRHKKTYHDYLGRYLETIFAKDKLHQQISQTATFLRPLVRIHGEKTAKRFERIVAEFPSESEPHPLKYFVTRRHDSVQKQLAGLSNGDILQDWEVPTFPLRAMIGWICAFCAVLLLNILVWIWTVVVGYRHDSSWGMLNLIFYPITPVFFGFKIRPDLGKWAAWATLFSALCGIGWAVGLILWMILEMT